MTRIVVMSVSFSLYLNCPRRLTQDGQVPLNLTTPVYPMDPPATPAVTQQMDIQFLANETGNLLWYVNNETFRANYE